MFSARPPTETKMAGDEASTAWTGRGGGGALPANAVTAPRRARVQMAEVAGDVPGITALTSDTQV